MTAIVGAEYLIGNAFIHLTKERFLRLADLNNYRIQIQSYLNSNHIDAVITGNIPKAAYDFENYFELKEDANIIILKANITKKDLEQRFVGYLPFNVLLSFEKVAQSIL